MDYQLAATKTFCANVDPRNKKRFLNPPMGDMPITEENDRVTISYQYHISYQTLFQYHTTKQTGIKNTT